VLFVVLTHLPQIFGILHTFADYFGTVIMGCVIAYIMNPLAKFFERTLFKGIKNERMRRPASAMFTLALLLILTVLLFVMLIPQLFNSMRTLAANLDTYIASLEALLKSWNLDQIEYIQNAMNSSNELLEMTGKMLTDNLDKIINTSANIGMGMANLGLSFTLSIYLLLEKDNLKAQVLRLMRALMSEQAMEGALTFFRKCDDILVRYISCSLLDSVIIGVANAVLMRIFGMEYIGLISVTVAVTNLIPTFGPIIGAVVGALILLLVRPSHALIFLVITMVLLTLDGNVIKPKLFGNSLGVSGLMILVSIIVFGNIFGLTGIILAMPAAAILDYSYKEILLPALERKRKEIDSLKESGQEQ
jgi:predicted PurR-regulated permease PerM